MPLMLLNPAKRISKAHVEELDRFTARAVGLKRMKQADRETYHRILHRSRGGMTASDRFFFDELERKALKLGGHGGLWKRTRGDTVKVIAELKAKIEGDDWFRAEQALGYATGTQYALSWRMRGESATASKSGWNLQALRNEAERLQQAGAVVRLVDDTGKVIMETNPSAAWHEERRRIYEESAADDIRARHTRGAEFWRGAAAAETAAAAEEKAMRMRRGNPAPFGLPYSGPRTVHRWGLGQFSIQPIAPESGSRFDWEVRADVLKNSDMESVSGNRDLAVAVAKSLIERMESLLSKEEKDKAYWNLYRGPGARENPDLPTLRPRRSNPTGIEIIPVDPASGNKWEWEIHVTHVGRFGPDTVVEYFNGPRQWAENLAKAYLDRLARWPEQAHRFKLAYQKRFGEEWHKVETGDQANLLARYRFHFIHRGLDVPAGLAAVIEDLHMKPRQGNPAPDFRSHRSSADPRWRDLSNMTASELLTVYNKLWKRTRQRMGGMFDAPTLRVSLPQVYEEMKALDAAYRRALLREGAPPALASEQMPRYGNPTPDVPMFSVGIHRFRFEGAAGTTHGEFTGTLEEAEAEARRMLARYKVLPSLRIFTALGQWVMEVNRPYGRRKVNPTPACDYEADPSRRINPTPHRGFQTFHHAKPDRTRKVNVPKGWPTKLWMLGSLKLLILSSGKRIHGGTVCAATGSRIYIINANYAGRFGPGERATQIEYVTPSVSERAGPVWFHPFDNPPPVREAGHGFLTLAGKGIRLTRRGIVG